MQVMYAENLQVRQQGKATPPLVPSRSLSARSDSTSSILPRSGEPAVVLLADLARGLILAH